MPLGYYDGLTKPFVTRSNLRQQLLDAVRDVSSAFYSAYATVLRDQVPYRNTQAAASLRAVV